MISLLVNLIIWIALLYQVLTFCLSISRNRLIHLCSCFSRFCVYHVCILYWLCLWKKTKRTRVIKTNNVFLFSPDAQVSIGICSLSAYTSMHKINVTCSVYYKSVEKIHWFFLHMKRSRKRCSQVYDTFCCTIIYIEQ